MAVATKRKWLLVDTRAPGPGRPAGVIEAVARTPIMGFRDDVVIRVSPQGADAARVDVRSASRFGSHDFGANASRVRALLEDIDDASGNVKEPKAEPEEKKAEKKRPSDKKPEKKK
jgi:hypothetical protein